MVDPTSPRIPRSPKRALSSPPGSSWLPGAGGVDPVGGASGSSVVVVTSGSVVVVRQQTGVVVVESSGTVVVVSGGSVVVVVCVVQLTSKVPATDVRRDSVDSR